MIRKDKVYTVREDVRCLKCGNIGAVKSYGTVFPHGVKEDADKSEYLEKYRNMPYVSPSMGFGGTIPHKCLNCGSSGLIDINGLEGYEKAFETIKEN